MKSLPLLTTAIAGSIILMTPTLNAAVIQVDLNDPATNPGSAWNTVDEAASGVALLDTSGGATGITLTASGWNGSGLTGQAGAFAGTFGDAADDYIWVENNTATITLSGIAAGSYKFEIVSSRSEDSGSSTRIADITVAGSFADTTPNGNDFDSVDDGFIAGNLLVWDSVTSNGTDDIVIQFVAGASENGHLNAFTITQIPEPSSTALLGLGGLVLILRRRR